MAKFSTKNLITKKNVALFFFSVVLLTINSWSIATIFQASVHESAVKGAKTKVAKKYSPKPSTEPTKKLEKKATTAPSKYPTPTSTKTVATTSNTNSSSNNGSNSSSGTSTNESISTQHNQQTTETAPTITQGVNPNDPKPTVLIVMHPGSGGASVTAISGNVQPVYVTPTPNVGPFEASFTYDSSNGKATVVANKPYKMCEGMQKDPESNTILTGMNGTTRWGCPDGKCGYICDIYFAPPNTPRYEWPYGVKVESDQGEVKTFGNW